MIKDGDLGLCRRNDSFLCKEEQYAHLPQISHSTRNLYVACKQAYYYYKLCGITAKPYNKSQPLKLGSIWDEFIQYDGQGKNFKQRFDELVKYYRLEEWDKVLIVPMFRAINDLCIQKSTGEHQKAIYVPTKHAVIHGYIDVWYPGYFEEHKFSGSKYYESVYNLAPQLGTYFLSDENLKYAVVKIAKKPMLRQGKNETIEQFQDRIYKDIVLTPKKYFIGYKESDDIKDKFGFDDNNKFWFRRLSGTATYGTRYYRDEFQPFKDVIQDYDAVTLDMLRSVKYHEDGEDGVFWQNRSRCHQFGDRNACEYLRICETRRVDESYYDVKGD